MRGIVYKSTGSWYTVKAENGTFYECRIKGRFRMQGIKSTNPIAVGDRVEFDVETKGDETVGIIHRIEERDNYIRGEFYWCCGGAVLIALIVLGFNRSRFEGVPRALGSSILHPL